MLNNNWLHFRSHFRCPTNHRSTSTKAPSTQNPSEGAKTVHHENHKAKETVENVLKASNLIHRAFHASSMVSTKSMEKATDERMRGISQTNMMQKSKDTRMAKRALPQDSTVESQQTKKKRKVEATQVEHENHYSEEVFTSGAPIEVENCGMEEDSSFAAQIEAENIAMEELFDFDAF